MRARLALVLVSLIASSVLASTAAGATARTQLTSRYQGIDAVHGESSTFGRGISATGRYVLFSSWDDALPGADGTRDIYIRDRAAGRTRLVTRNSAGQAIDANASDDLALSLNGRYAAFSTNASNLPHGGGTLHIYVRDLARGKTRLVSKTSAGVPFDDVSDSPSLSADGRFVAFRSNADNAPGEDGFSNIYVHDRTTGKTRLVSKTSAGVPADGSSDVPSISADGKRVSFQSGAENIGGAPAQFDVFVHDLSTRKTRLVSKTSSGQLLNAGSSAYFGSMSGEGRFIAFETAASNLPGGAGTTDVYLHDLRTGKTRLVSKKSGTPGDGDSDTPSVSGNGRFVAFESDAENFGGAVGFKDVFVFDRVAGTTRLVSRSNSGAVGKDDSFYASVSADGRYVAFSSRSNNFSRADDNDVLNTFVRGPLR